MAISQAQPLLLLLLSVFFLPALHATSFTYCGLFLTTTLFFFLSQIRGVLDRT